MPSTFVRECTHAQNIPSIFFQRSFYVTRPIIDTQFVAENVGFLDNFFDNSFVLQNSILTVKEYVTEEKLNDSNIHNKKAPKKVINQLNKSSTLDLTVIGTQKQSQKPKISRKLNAWGLPHEIVRKYENRGIKEMFDWQVSCLGNSKILLDCCNLVYSAPTSAGKTLVAEILTIKTILERQKKVIIILPFVSIVREKMFYLQDILSSSGIRVEGFMGSQSPPGGLQSVHVAICTIEKANSLVNRLLDEGTISDLGAVIIDELHLLGDPHRGYILELLLTKIKYVTLKLENVHIQIIGMSATLPNLDVLANWLEAELFLTQFRPIPLDEYCLVGRKYYDSKGQIVHTIQDADMSSVSGDNILHICLSTIKEGCSTLIFCMTKNRCESLAQSIAASFYKLGCSGQEIGSILRQQLKTENILEVLEQLKNCPVGLDNVLRNTISFGVAYHHAGLTFDERDIIEGGFKTGAIRVLVATSTLSSGVNLPARKVVVRSPVFLKQPISILTYKQMIGRAGRMGKDTKGESILICTEAEKNVGFNLMMGALEPVKSCIESEDKFMRAILEMIASEVACTLEELELYAKCTLLFTQGEVSLSQKSLLENTLDELKNFELIRIQSVENSNRYIATSLGKACLSSSMAPNDGLSLFCELQRARQCLVLETDLHLIYLVTPYSVSSQWGDIDWLHLLTLWESLTRAMKKVGELVGIQESFIIRCVRGVNKIANAQNKMNIHKRFYTALALQDLVNEVPLSEVAIKFQCARGFLQSLQQAAATFAGMVTVFSHQLGWKNMEMLIGQFQDRLHFGIHSELLELMKLPSLNGLRARSLFNAGYQTVVSIASAEVSQIENALIRAVPFESDKKRDDDDISDKNKRNKIKNVWITGGRAMTTNEAAVNLISEARLYLKRDLGVTDIKWAQEDSNKNRECYDSTHPGAEKSIDNSHGGAINQTKNVSLPKNIVQEESMTQLAPCSEHELEDRKYFCRENPHKSSIILEENHKSGSKENIDNINKLKQEFIEPAESETQKEKQRKISNAESQITSCSAKSEITQIARTFDSPKEESVWDSLNFSELAINNVTKIKTQTRTFSPEISFSDNEIKTAETSLTSIFIKDVSLFSSEGDSSLFEDSLPIDAIPSKFLDDRDSIVDKYKDNVDGSLNVNSTSIMNAFKSAIENIAEDEDMRLVYDEDNRNSDQIECTPKKSSLANENKANTCSTNKRHNGFKSETEPSKKKVKINGELDDIFKFLSKKSEIIVKISNRKLKCYVLEKESIFEFFNRIQNINEVSVMLHIDSKRSIASNDIIGSNILKGPTKQNIFSEKKANKLKGISMYYGKENIFYMDLTTLNELNTFKTELGKWLKMDIKLRLFSSKYTCYNIKKYLGIDISSAYDICIAEWLVDSEEKESNLQYLVKKYCGTEIPKYPEDSIEDVCVKTWGVWHVAYKQASCLREQNKDIENVLNIEAHIARILASSEYHGLEVDKALASQLLIDTRNSQEILQKKAFAICGYHFNFNSPKDVAKVLGIYKGKKVSTKKSVLTTHNSPMSSIVIFWRKLNSILTKTLYPLTEKAVVYGENDRVNPTYTMYTCSGRVSMHEPNLQNVPRTFSIPYKYLTEENSSTDDVVEFNCRNIFKASPGNVFVSADYCQLEMRILTHYSEDEVLTKIMRSNMDVFKSIAASWSSISDEEVDDDLRQKAKHLCYGIIYGMGNKTLGNTLDVSEMEAAVFMDTFHRTYPAIRTFTQNVIDDCKSRGYIETLMKRRRYLPDINSKFLFKRSAAERQAVNTTIQGSAADIAKAAMCEIDDRTTHFSEHNKPKLVLQMHDELIYEVPSVAKDTFVNILKDVMENTVTLNVPLPVKVKSGVTWGSLKEIQI